MSETAKTKRLKTMLFVWITTGVNKYIVKRWRLIVIYESKRKKNKEKMSKLVAIHFLIYLYIL